MTAATLTYDFGAMAFNRAMFAGDQIPAGWARAFKWHRTPQGVAFWLRQNCALDDEGRAALDAMVAAYDAALEGSA